MSDFMNEDKVQANLGYSELFKRLWPFMRRHKLLFFAAILAVLIFAAVSRALPFVIGQTIDQGFLKKDMSFVVKMAWIYLSFEIAKLVFQFTYNFLFQKFGQRMLYYVREAMLSRVQSLPMDYFNRTPVGRTVTRLTHDVSNLSDLFTEGVISVFVELIILVAILISMLMISPVLTLLTLAFTPLFLWVSYRLSEQIRAILRDAKKKLSELNSFVAENLNGIRVIQLYNRVRWNRGRFKDYSNEYAALTLQSIKAYALMHPVSNLFTALTLTSALYFGGWVSQDSAFPLGALVAFILHVQDFIPPLREILEKYQQFQNSLTSAERVFQLLDQAQEQDVIEGAVQSAALRGRIEARNLYFCYSPSGPLILKNLNFKIQSGESIALVGRTGSGKTTLITLLQKFYSAPRGTLFLDELPIEQISNHDLRTRVGVVQQDSFIFKGSILENITLADQKISFERARAAAESTGYLQLLQQTGRSLDFQVEERGANLSVGERQLIAFARILAFDPEILILDEATANIDSESEVMIQKATAAVTKDRTSIIIAHRLSTVQNCDRIFVLSEGALIEEGSHKDLIHLGGVYAQMVNSGQFEIKPSVQIEPHHKLGS